MPDPEDKLTSADVEALMARANTPSPGPALAAHKTLCDAVAAGEAAFVDQATYAAAQHILASFLNG